MPRHRFATAATTAALVLVTGAAGAVLLAEPTAPPTAERDAFNHSARIQRPCPDPRRGEPVPETARCRAEMWRNLGFGK